ncbi:hypothetical protein RFI_35366, partial [Reticulomyxa filosa]
KKKDNKKKKIIKEKGKMEKRKKKERKKSDRNKKNQFGNEFENNQKNEQINQARRTLALSECNVIFVISLVVVKYLMQTNVNMDRLILGKKKKKNKAKMYTGIWIMAAGNESCKKCKLLKEAKKII